MWLPILGLFLGIIAGLFFNITIPLAYSKYASVAVLAALDSILGAIRGILRNKFDSSILISGFFSNIIMAVFLVFFGERLGLDIYLAAIIVFVFRIFSNMGMIRRELLRIYQNHRRKEIIFDEIETKPSTKDEEK